MADTVIANYNGKRVFVGSNEQLFAFPPIPYHKKSGMDQTGEKVIDAEEVHFEDQVFGEIKKWKKRQVVKVLIVLAIFFVICFKIGSLLFGGKTETKEEYSEFLPAKIAGTVPAEGKVFLNKGESQGIKAGQIFNLVRENGMEIKDPDTGAILGNDCELVGTVQITEVSEKFSKAKVISGIGSSGLECRQVAVNTAPAVPTEPEKMIPNW